MTSQTNKYWAFYLAAGQISSTISWHEISGEREGTILDYKMKRPNKQNAMCGLNSGS